MTGPPPLPPLPPAADTHAEQALLGAMLQDAAAVAVACQRVEPDAFAREAHRQIFTAMRALAARGLPVDPITVGAELNGDLERVGGYPYIWELLNGVPTAANAGFHAGIVREQALRRRLVRASAVLGDPTLDAERRGHAIQELHLIDLALRTPDGAGGPGPVRSLRDVLADPATQLRPEAVVPRLAWKGRVTLFAGREKDGKSTFLGAGSAALSRGRPFLGQDTVADRVLWVGLEEHVADTAHRFDTFKADLDQVFLLTTLPNDVGDIRVAVRQCDPALVVVDSLAALTEQLVEDPGQASEWTPIMRQLASIARERDVAMVLIHHARKSDGRYRDSSAIGAGVDVILEMEQRPGEDAAVRHIRARGRWGMQDFAVRLVEGTSFELLAGGLSVDARLLLYIEGRPGCSSRALREHIGGRAGVVDEAIGRLAREGAIVNEGSEERNKWRVSSPEAERVP